MPVKKRFIKKLFLTLISSGLLFSCSAANDVVSPAIEFGADDLFTAQKHLVHGDIAVKFNNAYKALYQDNERIGRQSSDNPDKLFIKIVDEAKKSLDLAVFDIEEPNACQALIRAQKRGVKVRIITDSDNLNDKVKSSQPRQVLLDMKKAGIKIKEDNRTAFMHNKFVVMDDEVVITGSLNLTINSMYRDNNNSLKITSKELAADYKAEFNRLFVKGILGPNPHEVPYKQVNVEGATMNVYFSPKGGTKEAILQALKNARTSIKFMAFSLTDKDIQQVILDKVQAGIKVEGIFDGCMISKYSLYESMLLNKIPVLIDGNQALLHDKVFIIDNSIVITGSYNFSKNAEDSNNENTLVINSAKVAGFYNDEYMRLKNASMTNKNIPPYDNRACSSRDSGNDILQESGK